MNCVAPPLHGGLRGMLALISSPAADWLLSLFQPDYRSCK